MPYISRTTVKLINGMRCDVRLMLCPGTLPDDKYSVYANVALTDVPNMLLVNEVLLEAVEVPSELSPELKEQLLDQATQLANLDDVCTRADYTIALLTNLIVDKLGLPDHSQEGKKICV